MHINKTKCKSTLRLMISYNNLIQSVRTHCGTSKLVLAGI